MSTFPAPGSPEAVAQVAAFEENLLRAEGARLAQEARERERAAEELRREVQRAVDVAREALGRDAVNPVALATLASAVLAYQQTVTPSRRALSST